MSAWDRKPMGVARREYVKRKNAERAAQTQLAPGLVWIYEYWSANECLYVGKTSNWSLRRGAHRAVRATDSGAAQACREHQYVVLSMADDAEARRIEELSPRHNQLHA
jgi:hypothetical protein